MESSAPHMRTMIVVAVLAAAYLILLLRRTRAGALDLYDLFMLSTVALLPCLFTFFPQLTHAISELMGVAFPFVVMFGALFGIVFVIMHRVTAKVHILEKRTRLLVQENGLLAQKLEQELRNR